MTGDVPDLGAIRPPRVYLLSLATGAVLQYLAPAPFLPPTVTIAIGAALVAIAAALLIGAVAEFRAAHTPVPAREPTTTIVRGGPYRFSRNPIYLAFSLFQCGIAAWLNSAWLLATLAIAVALMHLEVIPQEEAYLERRFGAEYRDYRATVRRWL